MSDYIDNIDEIIKSFKKKGKDIIPALQRGLKDGMEDFSGKIQKEQMTGRPGLKTQTGTLKRSWFTQGSGSGLDYAVKLVTRSKYAAIHQFGGIIKAKNKPYLKFQIGGKWFQKKQITIPKRLHIYEEFKESGAKIIVEAMQNRLKRALI